MGSISSATKCKSMGIEHGGMRLCKDSSCESALCNEIKRASVTSGSIRVVEGAGAQIGLICRDGDSVHSLNTMTEGFGEPILQLFESWNGKMVSSKTTCLEKNTR